MLNRFSRHCSNLSHYEAILFIIVIAGVTLRLWNIAEMSLSSDELSGITSVYLKNFSALVEEVRTEGHPIGYRLFMSYWLSLFGKSVIIARLPFVIFGVLSIPVLYKIAQHWFSKTSGLFVAAFYAFLTYPIKMTQLARPYAPAILFLLLAIYFWTLLLFKHKGKLKNKHYAGFIVFSSLTMYFHNFGILMIGVVGLTGLLFTKRFNYKIYLLSGVFILILYLPHFSITWNQLTVKQGMSWLSLPSSNFLPHFIFYAFNRSYFVLYIFLGVGLIPIFLFHNKLRFSKYHVIALSWMVLPYLIGLVYSYSFKPILHYRAMWFIFPFLLLFGQSFWQLPKTLLQSIITKSMVLVCACILVGNLIYGKKYYSKKHYGMKYIASAIADWTKNYNYCPSKKVIDVYGRPYIHYYLNQQTPVPLEFSMYRIEKDSLDKLNTIMETSSTPCFLFGWCKGSVCRARTMVLNHYPVLKEARFPTNYSGVLLFMKNKKNNYTVLGYNNFDDSLLTKNSSWYNLKSISEQTAYKGKKSTFVDDQHRFSVSFKTSGDIINKTNASYLRSGGMLKMQKGRGKVFLVISYTRQNKNQPYQWQSINLSKLCLSDSTWSTVYWEQPIPKQYHKNDTVSSFLWSPHGRTAYLDDFQVIAIP